MVPVGVKTTMELLKGRRNGNGKFENDMRHTHQDVPEAVKQIEDMSKIIGKTDEYGLPLVYTPREWGNKFDTMIDRLDKIAQGLNGK